MTALRDNLHLFKAHNTQVLGVSTDSVHCHYAYMQYRKFGYPLLSDFARQVCKLYDAYYPERATAMPSTFLMDQGGIIRYRSCSDVKHGVITIQYGRDTGIKRDLLDRLEVIMRTCGSPFTSGVGACPIDWGKEKDRGLKLDSHKLD